MMRSLVPGWHPHSPSGRHSAPQAPAGYHHAASGQGGKGCAARREQHFTLGKHWTPKLQEPTGPPPWGALPVARTVVFGACVVVLLLGLTLALLADSSPLALAEGQGRPEGGAGGGALGARVWGSGAVGDLFQDGAWPGLPHPGRPGDAGTSAPLQAAGYVGNLLSWLQRGRSSNVAVSSAPASKAGAALDCPFPPDVGRGRNQHRLPPWRPGPSKYLLGFCRLNRWTNRLNCMERALALASLLNRTLVVPSLDVFGDPEREAIDVPYLRTCLLTGNLRASTEAVPRACRGRMSSADSLKLAGTEAGREGPAGREQGLAPPGTAREAAQADRLAGVTGAGVVSLGEYLCMAGVQQLRVDMLLCQEKTLHCPHDGENFSGRVHFPNATRAPVTMYNGSQSIPPEGLRALAEHTSAADVLCLGDTFYTSVGDFRVPEFAAVAPMFSSNCSVLVRPPQESFDQAAAFMYSRLGGQPYAAMHLRREDFFDVCKDSTKCTFWSMEQVAQCLSEDLSRLGLSTVFVASNGWVSEKRRLGQLLAKRNITMLVFMPAIGWNISAEENKAYWDVESAKPVGERVRYIELVDKVICARSAVFFHSVHSTFSYRIIQLRDGLGTRNCSDQAVCHGRHPKFNVSMSM